MSTADRILVIDDDENILRILSMILKQSGYLVDTATRGQEAIAKMDTASYQLAIIDVRLPDIECTKLLTSLYEKSHKLLKIILTGFPLSEDALRSITEGVDGYLAKPVNTEKLLNTVRQLLERHAIEGTSEAYNHELSSPSASV
jgi:two-component system response regulator GlrR